MDDAPFDLARCLAGVRRRDDAAARQLVEHLYPLVIKIVRSHRSPRLAEEDLAQDIFLRVFSRLGQYRGEVPFEHWVARVAVNTCLNALRGQRVRPELRMADLGEDEELALQAAMADNQAVSPQEAGAGELVRKMLDCLSPEDRLVISLLDLEERSVAEISRTTGWSQTLVKVRAFRARRKLKKILERLKPGEWL